MRFLHPITTIRVKNESDLDWKESLESKIRLCESDFIDIDLLNLNLNCKDIKFIKQLSQKSEIIINSIRSNNAETIISANSFGYKIELIREIEESQKKRSVDILKQEIERTPKTLLHQGTLHSGEHLESESDLFLIGDVNPGAIVRASGDVIIWGRLLGNAHAGKNGNTNSRISALQLRPVQLRIADKIARGPQEKPQPGFAEQAKIKSGMIIIIPASPN